MATRRVRKPVPPKGVAKAAPLGHTRALKTGAQATAANLPGLDVTRAEVQAAVDAAPWIQATDALILDVITHELHVYRRAAEALARLSDVAMNKKVNAAKLQIRRARVLGELLGQVGLTPLARSKLGLNVAKAEAIYVKPVRTRERAEAMARMLSEAGALPPVEPVEAEVVTEEPTAPDEPSAPLRAIKPKDVKHEN